MKNRFVRSAVWMKMATDDGHLTPELVQVYKDLADGGVALITTGYTYIDPAGQPNPRMTSMADDTYIDEWREVIDYIHQRGAKIVMQIVYTGSQTNMPAAREREVLAPSAVENRVTGIMPREMTREEIRQIERKFADAAVRVRRAGFDGVELHAAHGYLLSQFLTPYYNRRTDEYGGPIHNRARMLYETAAMIRTAVGQDFPLLVKLNFRDEMAPGEGLEYPESLAMFKHLSEHRLFDIIEVSACNESSGTGRMAARTRIRKPETQSYFRSEVAEIASAISTPVILMGGNRTPSLLTDILNSTRIPLFSLARPLLSEPDLINKWHDNPQYTPRCVSCNHCWESTPNRCILSKK